MPGILGKWGWNLLLKSVEIFNFRSFAGKHKFAIPDRPGVYLCTGQNLDLPELEGNGVGKSTLWDAIFWCLYGSTPRGVRAGAVVSWGDKAKTTSVRVEIDGRIVQRSQGPNSLTIDGVVVLQNAVDQLVGLSADEFSCSVLFGQFAPFFFDLSATEKLASLTSLLRLDVWKLASDKARELTNKMTGELTNLQIQQGAHEAKLNVYKQNIESYRSSSDSFETARQERIERQLNILRGLKQEMLDLDDEIAKRPAAPVAIDFTAERDSLSRRALEVAQQRGVLSSEKSALESKLDRLKRVGAVCQTCFQQVDGKHVAEHQLTFATQLEDVVQKITRIKEEAAAVEASGLRINKQVAEQKFVVDQYRDTTVAYNREMSRIESEAQAANRTIELIRGETNQFQTQIKETTDRHFRETKELMQCLDSIRDKQCVLEDTTFWIKGFRDVRLWVIDQCLAELEIAVNSSLLQLGMRGWKIEFSVERETQTGSVSRGFNVLVSNEMSGESAPWNSWSGGELQRLRIAGAIGFANLVLSRGCGGANFEVWDEPTAHLSERGIEDLLELLGNRAEVEKKVIWIVDHHSLDYAGFLGELKIVKENGVSRFT